MKKVAVMTLVATMIILFLVSGCALRGEAGRGAISELPDTPQSGEIESNAKAAVPTEEHYVYGAGREARFSDGKLIYTHQDYLGSTRTTTDNQEETDEDT
ncbi:MAG: hypothetical protein ABIE94_02250 [archaeon]